VTLKSLQNNWMQNMDLPCKSPFLFFCIHRKKTRQFSYIITFHHVPSSFKSNLNGKEHIFVANPTKLYLF